MKNWINTQNIIVAAWFVILTTLAVLATSCSTQHECAAYGYKNVQYVANKHYK